MELPSLDVLLNMSNNELARSIERADFLLSKYEVFANVLERIKKNGIDEEIEMNTKLLHNLSMHSKRCQAIILKRAINDV